jgi:hypothetical protein
MTCGAYIPLLDRRCSETPATPVRRACVHEHVEVGLLCDFCLGITKNCYCLDCYRLDGHWCPVTIVPLAKVAT